MKPSLILLGVALGLLTPLRAQADPAAPVKRTANVRPQRNAVIADAPAGQRPIYHITGTLLTGSHIPVVIREIGGRHRPIDSGFRRNDQPGGSLPGVPGASDAGTSQRRSEFGFF